MAHGHVRAPAGATLLATGDHVRHQAFRAGERAWGIQWHLEIDRPELESWLDTSAGRRPLTEWGKSAEEVRAEADTYMAAHEQNGTELFTRFDERRERRLRVDVSPYRPLIAVVGYHLAPGRVSRWPEGGYGVPGPYLEALRRSGARILIVAPGETWNDPDEILDPFDGLMLVGGGDVDPPCYGGEADVEHNYGIEPDRDGSRSTSCVAADRLRCRRSRSVEGCRS